jgi:hypothetical protein
LAILTCTIHYYLLNSPCCEVNFFKKLAKCGGIYLIIPATQEAEKGDSWVWGHLGYIARACFKKLKTDYALQCCFKTSVRDLTYRD